MLVQIAVYTKSSPGEEEEIYEEMGGDEGGVAVIIGSK